MNIFYNPSGSPATGSKGLSALMRSEFIAISHAFDMMPAFNTTGAFATVFNQQGNYTFNLPNRPGTLALLTDVSAGAAASTAAEAARAAAAEMVLSTAVASETTARLGQDSIEKSRALAAEGALAFGITTEAAARGTAVTAETVRATAAETALSISVTSEATTRLAQANAETVRASAAEGGLSAAITNETITRVAVVTAETTRATTAEAGLSAAITTEAATRWTADVSETTRALLAESILNNAINTKQATLGFAPVKQGFAGNTITIGWTGAYLSGLYDANALGQIPTQNYPGNFIRNGDNAGLLSLTVTGNVVVDGAVYPSAAASANGFYLFGDGVNRIVNWTADGWKFFFSATIGTLYQYSNTGTALFVLDTVGDLSVPGTVTGSNVSDVRTKRAITPYTSGLAAVIGLEPISYEYNGLGGTGDTGKTRWGVSAQQAQAYLPECVYETPEPGVDPTIDYAPAKIRLPNQLSFDEQPLLYAMVNAFRELAAELVIVKARLDVLEAH